MTPLPRRREREAAASILVIAAALAGWIVAHRDAPPPKPDQTVPRVVPETAPAQTAQSTPQAQPSNTAIELVELPASFFEPPRPKIVAPVKPAPHEAIRETPVEKPIVPLKPEVRPEPIHVEAPIVALRPEFPDIKSVIPLPPEEPRVAKVELPKPLALLRPVEETPPPPVAIKEPVREKPKPVATPAPVPKSAPAAPMTIVADNPETAGEGRVLLRLFEKGSGPGIEIRWPSDPGERDRLYDVFTRCLGMRDGIVDGDGRLFLPEGARAQPTALNTDRYSGFVRRPEGAISPDEQQEITRVRAYHQLGGSTSVARIFPRTIDAFLIGGLRQAVGETYLNTKSVRAAYRLNGSRVIVDNIVVDGRAIDGAIDLTSVSSGCRR